MRDHGYAAEYAVEGVCRRSFLADFVVRSPVFRNSAGLQREAADLLLPFRDELITFQVRSREDRPGRDPETEIGRVRKRIEHAIGQVRTTKHAIEQRLLTEVTNLRGIRLPFDCAAPRKYSGIVVVNVPNAAELAQDDLLAITNAVRDLKGIPVHVFLQSDFEVLAGELDTIPDLLRYLDVRTQLIRREILFPLTYELDLMALTLTKWDVVADCLEGKRNALAVVPGYWDAVQQSHDTQFRARRERLAASYLVDSIIAEAHRCIGNSRDMIDDAKAVIPKDVTGPGTVEAYVDVATELAGFARAERMEIGRKMDEKLRKGGGHFLYKSNDSGTTILYLVSPEEHAVRSWRLYQLASVSYVHIGKTRLIGVATEPTIEADKSYDFVLMDGIDFSNEEELQALAEKTFAPAQARTIDPWLE